MQFTNFVVMLYETFNSTCVLGSPLMCVYVCSCAGILMTAQF